MSKRSLSKMTKKDEISAQLKEREQRRKNSVVSNMISAPPLQQPSSLKDRRNPNEQRAVNDESGESVFVIKKGEIKSRRKQVLLQPSIHDRAAEKCKWLGISMNDVINQLLDRWASAD